MSLNHAEAMNLFFYRDEEGDLYYGNKRSENEPGLIVRDNCINPEFRNMLAGSMHAYECLSRTIEMIERLRILGERLPPQVAVAALDSIEHASLCAMRVMLVGSEEVSKEIRAEVFSKS